MALNYPSFSSRAGAVWRQVLVCAFLPWLRKYRTFREARILQALQSVSIQLKYLEEEKKTAANLLGEDFEKVKDHMVTAVATNSHHDKAARKEKNSLLEC